MTDAKTHRAGVAPEVVERYGVMCEELQIEESYGTTIEDPTQLNFRGCQNDRRGLTSLANDMGLTVNCVALTALRLGLEAMQDVHREQWG